ncbi:MAG: MGMT family protein [Tenuifilaceae bacterium]|nr:MGMT family protein [Bacteroidales bacterium]MDI9517224.1 MGMT family protein [Bacteroidota bacterium]NLH56464.1 MGMT family protein [Rikenellaceae bacterium]OQC63033.1 MAG: Methylated-DNA--protein-cysteine methyltransferase [Bacteroidetes bacterium ADurb.Bin008]HNV82124.1 MGMT family protein [Tenuifilaceae bacterium]
MSNDNFFHRVYEVTMLIPPGRVTSYGAIARYLGSPQAARMVGWALNSSGSCTHWVPAHRVVNRNGLLTGKVHFPGRETMKELLESEGVKVEDDAVVDFEKLFWDPVRELDFDQNPPKPF